MNDKDSKILFNFEYEIGDIVSKIVDEQENVWFSAKKSRKVTRYEAYKW